MTSVAASKSDVSNRNKIYSGYLFKQGSMFSKKFQKRYFVLYSGKILAYYSSEHDTDHKGEINLCHVIAVNESDLKVNDENIYSNVFQVTTPDRVYILSAPDIKCMNAWISFIRSCVFGSKIHSGWLTKQGDFVKSWKRRYFVLTSTKLLRYFEDEQQTKFKGIINVQHIQSIGEGDCVEPYWNFIIHLQTPDRLWLLNADSEQKRQEWLKMLDEGKKVTNYDEKAGLFVDIIQNDEKTKQRIKYVLQLYLANIHNKKGNIWHILNNDLKDYSNVQLLNDFNFLLQKCANDRQAYAELYRYMLPINTKKSKAKQAPHESLLLMRNMRDKLFYGKHNEKRKALFNMTSDNTREINAQCLLDRIYSYIMYNYNSFMFEPVQWARIKDYDETDKLITAKKILNEKRSWIKNVKQKQICKINERKKKFMIDVCKNEKNDENDEIKNENENEFEIASNFNRLDVTFKSDMDEKNERENEYFEFGFVELLYWEEYKNNQWYIGKEYANLKEEITCNTFYCNYILSMQQWDDLYESASNISQSNAASQYLSYDWIGENNNNEINTQLMVDKYGIYEYTPIKINHILSICLYCNYYQLQQILMSSYAANTNINESIDDWKLRHGKLAHWAQYLRECCEVFGQLINEKDRFYYSINSDEIDFGRSLKVNYNMPISMSRHLFVCQSYFEFENINDETGMLLSVTAQANMKSFYMNCDWCSDYPNEHEVLVLSIYPQYQTRIQSMVHISIESNEIIFNNYQFYMSAIADLERMINAQHATDSIGRDTKIALNEMINYIIYGDMKINENENENSNENTIVRVTKDEISVITTDKQADDDDMKQDVENKEQDINVMKKVRPKGTLKGKKINKENERNDIIFKLKAKRKKIMPDYIKSMFTEYCLSIKVAHIDISRMVSLQNGYREWRDIFMNSDDTYFKIEILIQLFPNLTEIRIDYISQAFTSQSIQLLLQCLKMQCMNGRDLIISIYRPNMYSNTMTFNEDNKGANIEDFSLQNALDKYLNKKRKIGENFNWFCRLNETADIPCIEIMRPHCAIQRNQNLSQILNETQINMVQQVLKTELLKNKNISNSNTWYLKRLYSGIENKFDATEFHKKCDGISHTISIIKSTNNFIFGAYTSCAWGRIGKWAQDKFAFLIQMNTQTNEINVINIKAGHEKYGMFKQSNGGPGFGKGDIKILNKADKSNNNTCNSNSFAFKIKPNQLVGGNGAYFKVADYEVFQIAFY